MWGVVTSDQEQQAAQPTPCPMAPPLPPLPAPLGLPQDL